MTKLKTMIRSFKRDQRGITAVEYAVLAAMVGVAIISLQTPFTNELTNAFTGLFSPSAS